MSVPKDPIQAKEYKKRLSQSLKGRKLSEEHKDKLKKSYYERHPEKVLENQRKYRNGKNREKYLANARNYNRRYYQMKIEERKDYNRMRWLKALKRLEEQAGRPRPEICEICEQKDRIVFDHNHKTGAFRGWICNRCNVVLGKVKDDKELLNKLISYLD